MRNLEVSIAGVIGAGCYVYCAAEFYVKQTSLGDNRVGLTGAIAAHCDARTFTFELVCLNRSSSRVSGELA